MYSTLCTRSGALRLLLLLTAVGSLAAQSNERIDELLAADPAPAGHAAYLVLTAAGTVGEDTSPAEALSTAQEAGLMSIGLSAPEPVRFGDLAYLLMESFDESGGVMYALLPGPRYATREVVFQGWSRVRRSPRETLSGREVVQFLSVYLNERGGS